MINNSLNKEWKLDFFKIFATSYDVSSEYEKADKLKFEHFPPVLANFIIIMWMWNVLKTYVIQS